MRFTAADLWVTYYFPLLKCVSVFFCCRFFSVLLFKCMDRGWRSPPISVFTHTDTHHAVYSPAVDTNWYVWEEMH